MHIVRRNEIEERENIYLSRNADNVIVENVGERERERENASDATTTKISSSNMKKRNSYFINLR